MTKHTEITGIPIDNVSYDEVLGRIESFIRDKRTAYIVTVNPEMTLNASYDERFYDVLKGAEIRTADGIGILWAAYYLSRPRPKSKINAYFQLFSSLALVIFSPKKIRSVLKERVTGSDLFPKIIEYSQCKGWRIFLLGASDGIAERAKDKLSAIYTKAKFAGCYAGTPYEEDEHEICEIINKASPDILFVAYGSPKQELWIHRNLFKLKSVKVAIGVGGAFDFYAGKIKRAPKFMQKLGLEWLWRLFKEPKRIMRIWNATVKFVRLIIREKMNK